MNSRKHFIFILWALLTGTDCLTEAPVEEDLRYWEQLGKKAITEALLPRSIHGIAKNVILFVGDGMGMSTITAARIFKGQQQGRPGEEGYLTFDKFPHVGLSKTYTVDKQVPDSAATGIALFGGVKSNLFVVGLDSRQSFNVCTPEVEAKSKVSTILEWAIAANKSTGLVTNTRITHATPAAAYGHSPNRYWECDSMIPEAERMKGCKDLGRQLVEDEPGKNINVILGGGAQPLRHTLNGTEGAACTRTDHKDLVWEWMQTQRELGRPYKFVKTKEQLMSADNDTYILGLFSNSHMPYDKDRDTSPAGHPSLSEMVRKAIDVLSRNQKGYVLIVEGGRIDQAHHENLAKIAIEEAVAFDDAIETALSKVKVEETLIIVTADHSHSMSINGYPKRGNPIEGVGDVTPEGFVQQTLSYINGPAYNYHRVLNTSLKVDNDTLKTVNTWKNLNLTEKTVLAGRYMPHQTGYWMDKASHTGEDVPIYAIGPMAHLIHGVHEQTHVAYTMAFASCIGPYAKKCRADSPAVVTSYALSFTYNRSGYQWNVIMIVTLGLIMIYY